MTTYCLNPNETWLAVYTLNTATMPTDNVVFSNITADITASATTITVKTGEGALFTSGMIATLEQLNDDGKATKREVVLISTISGDTLTITRGYEQCVMNDLATPKQMGNTAQSFSNGARLSVYVSKALLNGVQTRLEQVNKPCNTAVYNEALALTQNIDCCCDYWWGRLFDKLSCKCGYANVFGTGCDGDCVMDGNVYLCANKTYEFDNLTINSGAVVRFEGQGVPKIRVRNRFINNGVIDTRGGQCTGCCSFSDEVSGTTISNLSTNWNPWCGGTGGSGAGGTSSYGTACAGCPGCAGTSNGGGNGGSGGNRDNPGTASGYNGGNGGSGGCVVYYGSGGGGGGGGGGRFGNGGNGGAGGDYGGGYTVGQGGNGGNAGYWGTGGTGGSGTGAYGRGGCGGNGYIGGAGGYAFCGCNGGCGVIRGGNGGSASSICGSSGMGGNAVNNVFGLLLTARILDNSNGMICAKGGDGGAGGNGTGSNCNTWFAYGSQGGNGANGGCVVMVYGNSLKQGSIDVAGGNGGLGGWTYASTYSGQGQHREASGSNGCAGSYKVCRFTY